MDFAPFVLKDLIEEYIYHLGIFLLVLYVIEMLMANLIVVDISAVPL